MRMLSRLLWFLASSLLLNGCSTYTIVNELKLVGFDENVGKGKALGQVEGGDCVFHIFGHWLGGAPTLSRAFANAQQQKTTQITEVVGKKQKGGGKVRYMNNVTVADDGFDAIVFGKQCIMVSGLGFK